MSGWVDALEPGAPDIVAAWRGIDAGAFITVRREVRRRAGPGAVDRVVDQLAATADALATIVRALPPPAFLAPGGEGRWNVAQCVAHDTHARAGLVYAAALAAGGRWPATEPVVVPGVPGPATATRDELLRGIERSQRLIERSSRAIVGHETDPCPLHHPLVGRLRCGEWLLFAGVHDLMHLEQLHRIADAAAGRAEGG